MELAGADLTNSVEYPDGHVDTLSSDDHINVENDGPVSTQ